jgi:hypothetical protein
MVKILPALALITLAGCTYRVPRSGPVAVDAIRTSVSITLYRRPLELRLSKPRSGSRNDILVVYATGDGGWRGLDWQIFDWISGWNFAVGFSSKAYLKNLGYVRDTTTPPGGW